MSIRGREPDTTWIFSNKVAIIVWDKTPFAVLIESKEVAKDIEIIFEYIGNI